MAQQNKKEVEKYEDPLGSGKPNWAVLIPILVVFLALIALVYFL